MSDERLDRLAKGQLEVMRKVVAQETEPLRARLYQAEKRLEGQEEINRLLAREIGEDPVDEMLERLEKAEDQINRLSDDVITNATGFLELRKAISRTPTDSAADQYWIRELERVLIETSHYEETPMRDHFHREIRQILASTPTDSAVPEPADPPTEGPKVVGWVTKFFADGKFPASQIKWQMEDGYTVPVILQSEHEEVVRGLENYEQKYRDMVVMYDNLKQYNERLRAQRDAYADPRNWEVKVPKTVAMHMASNAFHDLAPQTIHQAIEDAARRVTITPAYTGPTPSDSTEAEFKGVQPAVSRESLDEAVALIVDMDRNPNTTQAEMIAALAERLGIAITPSDSTEAEVGRVSDKLQEVSQEADRLKAENERLRERVRKVEEEGIGCRDCDDKGWNEDRAGRYACACVEETEVWQELKTENERLTNIESKYRDMVVMYDNLKQYNERLRAQRDAYADPENWQVDLEYLTPHYIGPTPSDSAEPEQDDFEKYADEKVQEIARIMDGTESEPESMEGDGRENETVSIERGMLAFLLGEGPLMGTWFGTGPPPGERGNFWWRKYLRTRPPEGESVEGEVKQSEDRWTISHDRLPNAWQPGTRVRITKLPQTGGNDGDE